VHHLSAVVVGPSRCLAPSRTAQHPWTASGVSLADPYSTVTDTLRACRSEGGQTD
jgi:hypothetical protein